LYAIIVTTDHREGPDEWDTDHDVLLFADEATAEDYVFNHPPRQSDHVRTKYLMLRPMIPNMDVDAYSEARSIIHNTSMDALGRDSMGAGAEEAVMNRVLDALKED
jgi:hypothetical protein